jgi:hypothetical protein
MALVGPFTPTAPNLSQPLTKFIGQGLMMGRILAELFV